MKKKLISFVLSLAIIVTASSAAFAAPSDIKYSERPTAVEIDKINDITANFAKNLKKANNRDKVFEDYNTLLELAARNGDIYQINYLELEKLNYGMETGYDREYLNKNIGDAVSYGEDIKSAVKSVLESRYADDFKEYWGEERTAHIEGFGKKKQTEENSKKGKEFYDRYYKLVDSSADSIEFTKLLRDLIEYSNGKVKDRGYDNYLDFLYAEDNTGFDTEDIKNFAEDIEDYGYYINKFKNYITSHGVTVSEKSAEPEDPVKALAYVGNIDERLKEDYEYLVRNGLCFINKGGNTRGSTMPLSSYGDASIFVSGAVTMDALIHEFGHYQSFLHNEVSAEDGFFGYSYEADTQEINSQAFELISTDYYDDIYGSDSENRKFAKLMNMMYQIKDAAYIAMLESALYYPQMSRENISDEDLNNNMINTLGEDWYLHWPHFFISQGYYINYAITLFDALQIYDAYLKDKQAGLNKYYEACSYGKGSYTDITEKLGLTSAFDENAVKTLENVTEDIFKTLYGVDYKTALDYFENGTYLGKVFPTKQRVSVNGGEPRTLFAYSKDDYNYIGIRDLAVLLNGTSAQFDVEYNAEKDEINIISDKSYTSGTETTVTNEVTTAGQKAAGTYSLLRDGAEMKTGGMVHVNGHNYFLLRGLAENKLIDIEIGYDEVNDLVTITTK